MRILVVGAGSMPPTVSLMASPAAGALPLNTTLTATAFDNGVVVRYEWDTDGDGRLDAITSTPTLAWRYERVGPWVPRVIAVDDTNLSVAATTVVSPTQVGPAGWLIEPRNEGATGPLTLTADLFPRGLKTVRIQKDGIDIAGPIETPATRLSVPWNASPGT